MTLQSRLAVLVLSRAVGSSPNLVAQFLVEP
jgi:hypothetical protein